MKGSAGQRVDSVDLQDAGGFKVWRDYICQRKPVLINGIPGDLGERLTDEALVRLAGAAKVQVEVRGGAGGAYGLGRKVPMAFGEFVRRASSGDSGLYLTAQQVSVGPDGHAELTAPPVTQLLPLLPLRPAPVPHLVPQSINMWMGAAPEGSSTGLHHDFHDNLYVLLRGRKRFRLYPPSAAGRMYVRGRPAKTHANGRIVYEGQGDVAADGSDNAEVARWRARRSAEAAVASAEAAVSRGERGAAAMLEAAEARLEELLDGALENGGGSDDFDAAFGGGGDYDDDGGDGSGSSGGGDEGGSGGKPKAAAAAVAGGGEDEPPPPSFSRVDLSLPAAELKRRFPLFPGAGAAVVAEVAAGQCLYLPAGWFHEVTSYSEPGSPTHLALNWWFYPPDNLAPTREAYRRPYTSDYWPAIWEGRRARLEAAAAQPGGERGERAGRRQPARENGAAADGDARGAKRVRVGEPPGGAAAAVAAAARGGGGKGGKQRGRGHIQWPRALKEPPNRYYRGNTHPGTASGTAAAWPPPRERGQPPGGGGDAGGGSGGGGGENEQGPEDAVAAYFRENPNAARALFAQFLMSSYGGGGDEEGGGGGGGRRRPSPLAAGRRHHTAVAYRERKRIPKPHPDMS